MARFIIRACEQQTLHDGREHPIEAETPEQAAAILRDMIRAIDHGVRPWPEDADGERICRPDPREIIDGESFFELLDENGDWDRDVDPDADGEAPAAQLAPSPVPSEAIAAALKWADAYFEQSADDEDVSAEEQAERNAGMAAVDAARAWLASR